jgi:hypothetical protein
MHVGVNYAKYRNLTMHVVEVRSGAVGYCTTLQAGSLRLRSLMVPLEFFMGIILPCRITVFGPI